MSASTLMALYDPLIDTPFLSQYADITMDIDKYFKSQLVLDERYDFTKCPKDIVGQFPRTYIIISSNDVLRDESYTLADFLLSNGVSVEMKEYMYYCHGFMNMSTMDSYYNPGVQQVIEFVKDVF
jgi:acetyl esterase/lipase